MPTLPLAACVSASEWSRILLHWLDDTQAASVNVGIGKAQSTAIYQRPKREFEDEQGDRGNRGQRRYPQVTTRSRSPARPRSQIVCRFGKLQLAASRLRAVRCLWRGSVPIPAAAAGVPRWPGRIARAGSDRQALSVPPPK